MYSSVLQCTPEYSNVLQCTLVYSSVVRLVGLNMIDPCSAPPLAEGAERFPHHISNLVSSFNCFKVALLCRSDQKAVLIFEVPESLDSAGRL